MQLFMLPVMLVHFPAVDTNITYLESLCMIVDSEPSCSCSRVLQFMVPVHWLANGISGAD
jgi:hypothetical protein